MGLRFMAVIVACTSILMGGDARAQLRTITVTGFAMSTFDPDWVRIVTVLRSEGSQSGGRQVQVSKLADSLVSRLGELAPGQCSTAVGGTSVWTDVKYRDDGKRIKRKGVQVSVDIRCTGASNIQAVLSEISRWSQCLVQHGECGLFNDTEAIRVVSDMALDDARRQAESSTALLGSGMASIVTVNVNPMLGLEPSGGCGGYSQAFSQFYGRGQLSRSLDQFKVLRRAIAILTYELK